MINEEVIADCKYGWRHAWYPSTTTTHRPREGGSYDIVGRCERCGALRLGRVDLGGNLIGTWRYVHDDEAAYRKVKFDSVSEWRVKYMSRLRKQRIAQKRLDKAG